MSAPFGNIKTVMKEAMAVLKPPPDLTVSEWADTSRKLSEEASATPGQWRTEVVEYMREVMDVVGDIRVRRVSVMACAQVAKTEVLLNIIGYCVDHEPSPIMIVQPTLDMAKTFSKDRVAPMLRDTPCLTHKVEDAKTRDGDNTILQKKFIGGHIVMVGANSPSSLASRPIRVVLCDEVDRFPESAGAEGDPIELAVKRSTTFWNRILVFVSTPTVKGESRIEDEYEQGDMREWHAPCGHCGEEQTLKWSNVIWDSGQPDTAKYMCEHCGTMWNDTERNIAVRKGRWIAQRPFVGNASFRITGMMSPFVELAAAVREFLAAKGNPEKLKVWTNTYLGETWEDQGERLDFTDIMEQRGEYKQRELDEDITYLTAGADVQDDRIEVEVVGWGDDMKSWSVEYKVIYGDPSAPEIWSELRSYLKQSFMHPLFGEIPIRATCIDTGGHYTSETYKFTKTLSRVFPIKGVGGEGRVAVGRPSRNNIGKVQLFPLGSDTLKELVLARLRVRDPSVSGYCHFPADYGEQYFRGITAEKRVTVKGRGKSRKEYVKIFNRNEPLDNRCYATAATEILAIDVNAHRRTLMRELRRAIPEPPKPEPAKPYRPERRSKKQPNYAENW